MINTPVLILASRGHIDSLAQAVGHAGIDMALRQASVDPDDLRACLHALYDTRVETGAIPETPEQAYMGGSIDGFLLGVKAARGEDLLDGGSPN